MEISFHRVLFYITSKKLTVNEHTISMPRLVGVDDWLASYGTTELNSTLFQQKNGYGRFLPFTAVTERNFLT